MAVVAELTIEEQRFLDACNQVQSLGKFPSALNFIRHTKYRWPANGRKIGEMRDRMVALGVLTITTEPATGNAGKQLVPKEQARLKELSLAKPRLTSREIWERFNKETGVHRSHTTIKGWVDRIRDVAGGKRTEVRNDDEAAIKSLINRELQDAIQASHARIQRLEDRRAKILRIDTLEPAEACREILADWKKRFGKKKSAAVHRPTGFTHALYAKDNLSRRMERARGVACIRRHAPYGMESGVG